MSTNVIAVPARPASSNHIARLFANEIRYEFLKMLRTRTFSLSVLGFPVMFYLLFGASNRHSDFARYLMASYTCMGVVSACLFGIGMGISMERAQGWLELKLASPMPRIAYLVAKIVGSAACGLIIEAALVLLAVTIGGTHLTRIEVLRLTGIVVAGSLPFAAMALLVAVVVPANSAPGIINLIYLPMSFASGFWMPVSYLPHWPQHVAPALPTYHSASLQFNPPPFVQFTLSPSTVTAGQSTTGTLVLGSSCPVDLEVNLLSYSGLASIPTTPVLIPKNTQQITFTANTPISTAPFAAAQVPILASCGSSNSTAVLTVEPSVVAGTIKSLSLYPASVPPGGQCTGTVTLQAPVNTPTLVGLASFP